MPAAPYSSHHGDLFPQVVDTGKSLAVGGGHELRKTRSIREYDRVESPSSPWPEKVERRKSLQPHKKTSKLTLCVNGALKCLGSFKSKESREDEAAIFAIQEECAKYRLQEGPSQRGYRRRQEALHSVIADARGLEPCVSLQKRSSVRREGMPRNNSTPILGSAAKSPLPDKGQFGVGSPQRHSVDSRRTKLSHHKVGPSGSNEQGHFYPKTSYLESYMNDSRGAYSLGSRTVRFQDTDNILPARPAEVVRIK